MTSIVPARDPKSDNLLSPENSALLIIDYQPTQVNSINSMDKALLVRNILTVTKIAQLYELPIVLSTVNVSTGKNQDTIAPLRKLLTGVPSYDRTSINAWEDQQFLDAVRATDRKKLIMCALWTEACLTFPSLDAMQEEYAVYPVTDAVAGTSVHAHETALSRLQHAGAQLISISQLLCELQRDWNRSATVPGFIDLLTEANIFPPQ